MYGLGLGLGHWASKAEPYLAASFFCMVVDHDMWLMYRHFGRSLPLQKVPGCCLRRWKPLGRPMEDSCLGSSASGFEELGLRGLGFGFPGPWLP